MKIAVTTSDGNNVSHFGKAKILPIYEFDEKNLKLTFLENRKSQIDVSMKHQWNMLLDMIKDCDVVICAQAGMNAKFGLENAGIKVVLDEGSTEEVLERYRKHVEFMNKPL
ncbi:hypothetical protein HYG87_07360 [Methanobacterium alkalithermotolerans]|uniref:Dinitrogenase iron-molybdenum cofactor biosynthesis domain-containing protein n=1 Tax=Methanobacterium alkalithermotolerans TaxID=2731220 RepID=A0A8T8K9R6_9EURY|nr:NifB/NifX family molybdenum-iron cluster-binding protein [Methanobacterium alkalithermotolerans]QUH23590.1 hypothetical protein HYG87_07360 [Methanobacterium alkalithermotolerans]RJS49850.1 MAG: hypothetical protein CIT03_01600 [Methanobacterium sp.]